MKRIQFFWTDLEIFIKNCHTEFIQSSHSIWTWVADDKFHKYSLSITLVSQMRVILGLSHWIHSHLSEWRYLGSFLIILSIQKFNFLIIFQFKNDWTMYYPNAQNWFKMLSSWISEIFDLIFPKFSEKKLFRNFRINSLQNFGKIYLNFSVILFPKT